jgi:hypothetical protein
MVELEQDLKEIESWDPGSGGKVSLGMHEAVIDTVEVKTSTTGFPKLDIRYKVVAGDCVGATVFGSRSLHPNALPFFRGMLDVLNCFSSSRKFDEQKLVGRYLRIYVEEYDKANDAGKGLKVEKLFKSEINDHKNEQLDIAQVDGATKAPTQKPQPQNGKGGQKPPAHAPAAPVGAGGPKANPDDDLPF